MQDYLGDKNKKYTYNFIKSTYYSIHAVSVICLTSIYVPLFKSHKIIFNIIAYLLEACLVQLCKFKF